VVCYLDGEPVGWVDVGDRSEYPRLQRSPVTKALDDEPVWVITCLFVRHTRREQRLQAKMIAAACAFAASSEPATTHNIEAQRVTTPARIGAYRAPRPLPRWRLEQVANRPRTQVRR